MTTDNRLRRMGRKDSMNALTKMARYLGLASPGDPTSHFPASSPGFRPSYAFATRALNGIPYSAPVASLECLGPASRLERFGDPGDIELHYHSLGLSVTLDREGVVSFQLDFAKDWMFSDALVKRHTTLDLSTGEGPPFKMDRNTTSDQVDVFLGQPHDRFAEGTSGELGTIYLVSGTHLATFHSPDGAELRQVMLSESA